jgi:hypothetical protein
MHMPAKKKPAKQLKNAKKIGPVKPLKLDSYRMN